MSLLDTFDDILCDSNVGTSIELLLVTAAHAALAALFATPGTSANVFPLHDAMRALQTGWKLQLRRPLAFAHRVHLFVVTDHHTISRMTRKSRSSDQGHSLVR